MPSSINKRAIKGQQTSSVAKKAARNAMLKVAGTTKVSQTQLERVVQSVNDATKRLSQPESILSTSTATKSSKRKSRDTVGPWKLGKTLGKGSSGRVRLAKNMETGQLAAIKIVPRKKNTHAKNDATSTCSSASYVSTSSNATSTVLNTTGKVNTNAGHGNPNPYGIEREIVIMKLISHSNVLGLYEVWENKSELYLVLEYVDGGELFDYLVSKSKLCEREAVHYFKQIVQGVSYCHSFNICHRDLKPENLLLDKKNRTIKIADFGMAALEITNKLLVTSCGSPHYASPEIVMGKPYHGGPSDVWSCGIILFALLTGHLPFNDDSIKKLLLKVQSGRYQMPMNLSKEAQDLISKILVVNPAKRISTEEILGHPLITKYEKPPFKLKGFKTSSSHMKQGKSNSDLHLLNEYDSLTVHLTSRQDIDDTILSNLQILWHGASRELIIAKLLQPSMCEEKIFYSLLLKYKEKNKIRVEAESRSIELKKNNENNIPTENNEVNERKEVRVDSNAPRLLQKSQFSVPSLNHEDAIPPVSALPSSSQPPTLPVFAVSSSRTFKKSGTMVSVQSQKSLKSKASIVKSHSKKSLSKSNSVRTLQNSASKRSLYSLTSISKRSLNLNEYVISDNNGLVANELPPLPSMDSNNDFEDLCDQILFGNGLDKIMEEEEEVDSRDYDNISQAIGNPMTCTKASVNEKDPVIMPPGEDLEPAFVFSNQQILTPKRAPNKQVTSGPKIPFKDLTNTHLSRKPSVSKLKRDVSQRSNLSDVLSIPKANLKYPESAGRNITVHSATYSKGQPVSLDPRRNASQPPNAKVVESLLHKFKEKSNIKENRKSNDWSYSRGSIFGGKRGSLDQSISANKEDSDIPIANSTDANPVLESLSDFDNTDVEVLAHSSTVRTKPLLPSISFNPTVSFKNLNEYLNEPNESYVTSSRRPSTNQKSIPMRKQSSKMSLAPKNSLIAALEPRGTHSKTNSAVSNEFDLMSDMSYALEIPTNTFMAQAVTISNHDSAEHVVTEHKSHGNLEDVQKSNESHTPATIYDDTKVNIFEDAPTDAESFDLTSSEEDSIPNVHRKAVSIETLSNTNVLPPSTNVRVSLYVNNNANSNTVLPRETTEEIISKFQMPAEISSTHARRRVSSTDTNHKYNDASRHSASMISMFKDVEEDENDETFSQNDSQDPSNLVVAEKEQEPHSNRVTMLFDAEEEEQHKISQHQNDAATKPKRLVELKNDKSSIEKINEKENLVTPEVKPSAPKVRPTAKVRNFDSVYNSVKPKNNWLKKFFNSFRKGHENLKFSQTHKTSLSFDDAHMLTLNEFDKNAVDYYMIHSGRKDRKEMVEYDCKFVSGNFKFRIKIVNDASLVTSKPTLITIKKKSGKNSLDSERAFQIFNADVARVIRQLELKK